MVWEGLRSVIAKSFWRLSHWNLVHEPVPLTGPRLLIGAPHTSNFDFVLMLAIAWEARLRIHWLGKNELFRGPAGPIMRALGGIAVDRANPGDVVAQVRELARVKENFIIVVTPEGTRRGNGWRSGFYRIAMRSNLPVTLGFVDKTTMTSGLGPTIHLTGDVVADMDRIREFYADKAGVNPDLRTEPRFSDESGLTQKLAAE